MLICMTALKIILIFCYMVIMSSAMIVLNHIIGFLSQEQHKRFDNSSLINLDSLEICYLGTEF